MLIRWDEVKRVYTATCSQREVDLLDSRWVFSQRAKRYESTNYFSVKRLLRFAADDARQQYQAESAASELNLAASTAHTSDIDLPAPRGKVYRPFQRAGMAYALERPNTLIADEMGLGKTIEAIGICNADPFSRRVLIICPASLRLNWEQEWLRWNVTGLTPKVITDRWRPAKDEAVIMSYEATDKWKDELKRKRWDIVILDEAHYVKNPVAKRTRNVLGTGRKGAVGYIKPIEADRILMLTGTPILNRPEELWPLIHRLDSNGIGRSHTEYRQLYVYRNDLLDELHTRLRGSIMVRRLKKDVLRELPAKTRQLIPLWIAGADGIVKREKAALAEAKMKFYQVKAELSALPLGEAARKLTIGKQALMGDLMRIRHETALQKLPAVIDHAKALLLEVPKLVLFAHHHDVVDGLLAALGDAVVLDGRLSGAQKDEAVVAFQTGKARVFIGSIKAAGLGITLTAAATVLFAELDWTPAAMCQAEDRCHRMGQRESVLVQHLVLDGTIDAMMSNMLVNKQVMLDQILDGIMPEFAHKSIVNELVDA